MKIFYYKYSDDQITWYDGDFSFSLISCLEKMEECPYSTRVFSCETDHHKEFSKEELKNPIKILNALKKIKNMTAKERINHSESLNLYKKVGKKYIQATDNDAYNGLRQGWWLVKVEEGCASIRQCVYPDKAELQAAIRDKEEKLVEIIRKATEAKPKEGIKMSEQAKLDWLHFISKHSEEFNALYYPSFQEAAEKIIKALLEE